MSQLVKKAWRLPNKLSAVIVRSWRSKLSFNIARVHRQDRSIRVVPFQTTFLGLGGATTDYGLLF